MSDDKGITLNDICSVLQDRVSELERKYDIINSLEDSHGLEIAELRVGLEALEDHKPLIYGQLNELKEQVKSQSKFWHILSEDMVIQRKVLRELIDLIMKSRFGVVNKPSSTDYFNLLEKLDGVGSARQTEKKLVDPYYACGKEKEKFFDSELQTECRFFQNMPWDEEPRENDPTMEHSREDELNIIIIGLQGKIEKLISEFMKEFDEFVKVLENMKEARDKNIIRGVIPKIACLFEENLRAYGKDGYKRNRWRNKLK